MLIHIERHVEVAFRDIGSKILELIERPDVEIPDDKERQNACCISRAEHQQELFLRVSGHGSIFFNPRAECYLARYGAVLHIVENRHAFFNEIVVFRLISIITYEDYLAAVFALENICGCAFVEPLLDLIAFGIKAQHVDGIGRAPVDLVPQDKTAYEDRQCI